MRVAIDTSALYTTQAGVARYTRGLLQGLRSLQVSDLELLELAWKVPNLEYHQPMRALRTAWRELFWGPLLAPGIQREWKADLLHSLSGLVAIPPRGVRHAATLHDLAVLRHPERFRPWHRWSSRRQLPRLARCDKLICVSRFTADEAMALLGVPSSKLVVVHNGCDFEPSGPPLAEQAPQESVPQEFLLFVGSLEPGKNLALLRGAYTLAESGGCSLPPLVIVGARWAGVPGEGPPPAHWHYLGRQPDEVLVYLYRRARALVFPSIYEGFGLPPVEAMAHGCPVICSRVASLPEVAGAAAVYAGLTPESYLDAITRLMGDDALRNECIERGRTQAAKFSWRRCGEETLAVYRDLTR